MNVASTKRITAALLLLALSLGRPASVAPAPLNVTVSATVLDASICWFNSAASALNFGAIDPTGSANANAVTSIQFRCISGPPTATFFIDDDDGLHETGPDANRMQHTTVPTQYLPYSLNLSPGSGTVPVFFIITAWQTLTISGTVTPAAYQNAYSGAYTDTVVITIIP
jgi:spore coat protein U-like protein